MRKVLSIFSTLILTGSAASLLTTNIHSQQIQKNEEKANNEIDWNFVKSDSNNYFKNLKNNAKQKFFATTQNKYVDINEVISYAEKKANQYITISQVNNFSLDQMIEYLSNENNNFKENYNKILVKTTQKSNNDIVSSLNFAKFNSLFVNNENIPTWKKSVQNLKTQKTIFQTISTTAAVASAGFWAASWWFGITIPWAMGCTVISVSTGILATVISGVITVINKELSYIEKVIGLEIVKNKLHSLGTKLFLMLYSSLIAEEATISASVWSFPPAAIVSSIVASIIAWVTLYK